MWDERGRMPMSSSWGDVASPSRPGTTSKALARKAMAPATRNERRNMVGRQVNKRRTSVRMKKRREEKKADRVGDTAIDG